MPIYEYQCKQCGRTLEKRQKFSDLPLTVCPHCSGELEKLISAPAVQFKGGGWYADLYSSSKGNKPAASGEGAAPASGSSEGSSGTPASSSSESSSSGKSGGSSSESSSSGGASSSSTPSTNAPAASAPSTNK